MDLSNLTPAQQTLIFNALKAQGQQPTTNMGEASAPDIQPQEGDQVHPMAAMQQIAQQLLPSVPPSKQVGPQTPQSVNLATGPKISPDQSGQLRLTLPADNPLLKFFGVKQHIPVNTPNYLESAKAANLTQYLPSGLAQMPDGTPFVGKTALEQARENKTAGGKKPVYTADQVKALLNPTTSPDELNKAFGGQTPQDVLSDRLRLMGQSDLMSRHNEGQWNKFTQAVVPGLVRGNTAAGIEARKLFSANHALSLFDQVRTQEGGADSRQQAEAAMNVASLLMQNGVTTEGEIEKLLPNTWRTHAAKWQEFILNDPTGTHAEDFMNRLEDTVKRQVGVSTSNLKKAVAPLAFGFQHLRKEDPSRFDNEIMAAVNSAFTIDANGRVVSADQAPQAAPTASPVQSSAPASAQPVQGGLGVGVPHPRITIKSVRQVKP